MAKAIGIDLGTTNSVAAIKGAEARVLQNKENEDLTPSVVGMRKNEKIVGSRALDYMASAPKDTIISIKRLMGRAYRDPEVQKVREAYAYDIVTPTEGTDDDVRVVLGGKQYSPIEISSFILAKIKEDAKLRLNDDVEFAVITVPAYFTDKQIDATRKAGQMAGLRVQRILDEPTAAAIAFGVDNIGPDECKTILVYDLGGGTFDVSVLTIVGGVFAQLAIKDNMWLGGDDFDHKIMALVVEHVKTMYEIDARKNAHFMGKLRQEAEKAKKILSSLNQAEIVIPSLLKDSEGNLIDLEMEISREQLEGMIRERVNESINLVKEAMVQAQVTADQIDHILLVGGSSSIPLVRRSLAALFGEAKIMMNVDPMKCVAYGAARLSATLGEQVECSRGHANPGTAERRSECGDLLTQDRIVVRCSRGHVNPGTAERCSECGELLHIDVGRVTGQDYGIQAKGDVFEIIIKQGTSFPTREPVIRRFVTPAANLRRIKAPVYAGTNKVATKNELQITVWLELPEHLPESTPVDVSLSLDENGSFERVKASLKDGSGREVEAYPDRGSDKRSRLEKKIEQAQRKWQEKREQVDDNEQIEKVYSQVIKAANANQVEDAEKLLEQMRKLMPPEGWVERAKGILNYSDAMLGMYGWLIEEPQKSEIKKAMGDLSEAIAAEDEKRAEERFKRLDKLTDEVPPPVISLMIVTRAIIRARRLEMVVEADQLTTGRQSMVDALRAHDFAHGSRILAEIWPTVEKVLGRRGESGKLGEDLLEVASPGAEAKR